MPLRGVDRCSDHQERVQSRLCRQRGLRPVGAVGSGAASAMPLRADERPAPFRRRHPGRRAGHAHAFRHAQGAAPDRQPPLLLHLLDRVDALGADSAWSSSARAASRSRRDRRPRRRDRLQAEQKGTGHAVQQAASALQAMTGRSSSSTATRRSSRPRRCGGCSTGSTATAARAWSCSPLRRPIRSNMAGSSSARATASPRWSNIRTRPRRSARSACAIRG